MKCVCPMGGDRTCPDDCLLAVWTTLPPNDRKVRRKAIVVTLRKQGFEPEAIATQLSVGLATIYRDLDNVSHDEKRRGVDKIGRKKGGGRPKGKRSAPKPPEIKAKHDKIVALSEGGTPTKDIAATVGIGQRMVDRVLEVENARREGMAVPEVERPALSMSAQEKLDTAIRQHKRKLDIEFEARCREECMRWLNEVSLPHYRKELEKLEHSIRRREGVMDRITYRKILSCLHPDRVQDTALKKRYEEAFRLFTDLEKRVLDEKESPTTFRTMPRTYEELMAMKAKVQAERKAKRHEKSTIRTR